MKWTTLAEDTTWIKVLIICFIHFLAPQIRPLLRKYEPYVNSFAGGMAVTYIFGHLLPEINEGHEVVGQLIYLFILLGFLLYYGLERKVRQKQLQGGSEHQRLNFMLSLGGYCLYNFLIVFSIPDSLSVDHLHVLLMALAMGMHLLHSDFEMGSKHPQLFDNVGRYCVIGAMVFGYILRFLQPESEVFEDAMTAFLAGSIVYSVFKKELPYPERTNIKWFIIGVVVYTILLSLLLMGE